MGEFLVTVAEGLGDDRGEIELSRGSLRKPKVVFAADELRDGGGCRGCGLSKLSQGGARLCCLCVPAEPLFLRILSLDF